MTDRETMKLALEALIWTTGSGDFGEGGIAREGAVKCLFPAITALRQALEQPEQEPVAWQLLVGADTPLDAPMGWRQYNIYDSLQQAEVSARTINSYKQAPFAKIVPLYAAPQKKTHCTTGNLLKDAYVAMVNKKHQSLEQPECNPHPDAPHGFNRDASHNYGRYVCDCEGREPQEHEPVAWIDAGSLDELRKGVEGVYIVYETEMVGSVPLYATPTKKQDPYVVAVIGNWGRVEWAEGVYPQIGDKMYSAPPKREWVGLTDEERYLNDCRSEENIEYARAIEAKLKEKNHG